MEISLIDDSRQNMYYQQTDNILEVREMTVLDRILCVIDGDNFRNFFEAVKYNTSIEEIVKTAIGDRVCEVSPILFVSQDRSFWVPGEDPRKAFVEDRQKAAYFDLRIYTIRRYFVPAFPDTDQEDGRVQHMERIVRQGGHVEFKHSNRREALEGLDRYPVIKAQGYGDTELVVEVWRNIDRFDTLMLFTHDHHFVSMVRFLQEQGKRVELFHYGTFIKQELRNVCNKQTNLAAIYDPIYPDRIQERIDTAIELTNS